MDPKEKRKIILQELNEKYDEVLQTLKKIPGVISLEVGFKEVGGKYTDQIVFRVIVEKKLAKSDVPEQNMIPDEIMGIKTDVIEKRKKRFILGTDQLPDSDKERPLRGGIQVGNNTGSVGTLGCIATWEDDEDNIQRVILSNEHVLYAGGAVDGQKIGQPDFYRSPCGTDCDKVGINVDSNTTFDCAIAQIDEGIEVENKVKEIGDIKGIAEPAVGQKVIKRGRTTGLTSGEIKAIDNSTKEMEIEADEGRVLSFVDASDNPLMIGDPNIVGLKYGVGTEKFAYSGDSGSVILLNDDSSDDHHKIVGLLNSVDTDTNTLGYGYDINEVVNALNITIHSTPEIPDGSIFMKNLKKELPRSKRFARFEGELKKSIKGQRLLQLFYQHRKEAADLINENPIGKEIWINNQGPRFIAALNRSVQKPDYKIPKVIEGIEFAHFVASMVDLIKSQGSSTMKKDLEENWDWLNVLYEGLTCSSDLLDKIKLLEQKEGRTLINK